MKTNFIFYALAITFFIGFLACLAWYYMEKRKNKSTKAPLSWTIESAKKFLAENDKSKDDKAEVKAEKVVIIDQEKFKEVKSQQMVEKKKNTLEQTPKKTTQPKTNTPKTNK